jgi:hypothetical protein
VEDKHASQTTVPIPPTTDEVDITSDVIVSVPTDDIDLIKLAIDTMLENNYNKKVDINEIMRELENFYLSNNLDTYKTFIIEYVNQRNSETEVMHIDFCFESYLYTYNDILYRLLFPWTWKIPNLLKHLLCLFYKIRYC